GLMSAPWIPVARAADGRPVAVAAAVAGTLTIVTAAPASSLAIPLLLRAVGNALGDRRSFVDAETLAISDAQLRAWTRPPGPAPAPRLDTLEHDDRRWLWIVALVLLAVEWRMRRSADRRSG